MNVNAGSVVYHFCSPVDDWLLWEGPWPRQLLPFPPFPPSPWTLRVQAASLFLESTSCQAPGCAGLSMVLKHFIVECWVLALVFRKKMNFALVLQHSCTWYLLPIIWTGQYDITLVQSPAGKSSKHWHNPSPSPWQIAPLPLSEPSQGLSWLFVLLST